MTGAVAWLIHVCAPWQHLYSNSKAVDSVVSGAHLLALLFGGGMAVAADRATLRMPAPLPDDDARRRMLDELHTVHRPVLVALAVLFVSGLGLAAADVESLAKSPVFGVKLLLVTLLLANGGLLVRTESVLRGAPRDPLRARRLWRRLRLTAWCSLSLWAATVVAGTVLLND